MKTRRLPSPARNASATLPKTLSIAEIDKLIATAEAMVEAASGKERARAIRFHCLLELLYATGMRVTELVSLPMSVLRGDGRLLTIKGKGGRERQVPLSGPARLSLNRYLGLTPAGEADGHVPRATGSKVAVPILQRRGPSDAAAVRARLERTGQNSRNCT